MKTLEMSLQAVNKATVTRFNKAFIQNGDMEAFNDIIAPDFINHTAPPGAPIDGSDVIYFFNHILRPAFPDLTVEIYDQVAEDDKVTTRKAFHGTHQGEFMGIPATGKQVVMPVIDILTLRDGKFIEHWGIVDMPTVMAQITG